MGKAGKNRILAAAVLIIGVAAAADVRVVDQVLSGDVVRIGDAFVARMTGLRAPSRNEPLGQEIYDFTKREIEGRAVRLVTWTTDNTAAGIVYDGDGRAFIQIFYGRGNIVSFNEVLLKKGYARVDLEYLPEDLKHFLDLEKKARAKGLGVWRPGRVVRRTNER